MEILLLYFNNLTDRQIEQFSKLLDLYTKWNSKINVISRKDLDGLYLRHVLHSLAIAKVQEFKAGSKIFDVGTGGGFPGIPLAILYPESDFYLVDSIGKKIKVVEGVVKDLELTNVKYDHIRAEEVNEHFDFIVSRAVARMDTFVTWTRKKIAKKSNHELKNGILYLKGGDLTEELRDFPKSKLFNISDFFKEDFFDTKKVVHLPLKYKP